jgi:peptidoglycan/xylan/chitin deacetylase (PgdA/CDA1 family)
MAWLGIDQWLGGEFESELTSLSWSEISELAELGWEVGSHTRSHPHLTQLDDESLESELQDSRRECEQRLGRLCTSLAYPYGDFDERVVAATRRAGYAFAGTLPARLHPPRPHAWPRIGIYHADGEARYALKVSPSVRRLRSSSAWSHLDVTRRRLGG